MNALTSSWELILQNSARGSAFIVFVILVRLLGRRWLPANCLHFLWLLVAARLLLPFIPESHASVFGLCSSTAPAPESNAPGWQLRVKAPAVISTAPQLPLFEAPPARSFDL